MPKYDVYGTVTGSIYLGQYEAETGEEAEQKALDEAGVSFCHQCSEQCEDPEITGTTSEEVDGEADEQ